MNAVIIYDDLNSASKATAMLERAAHRASEALPWNIKPWRLDMMILHPLADAALKDATEAHLIVLAVRNQADMGPWLLDWLELWAARRQVQAAAVALWSGGNSDTLSATVTPELSQFAQRNGLSIILGDVGPTEDESAFFARDLRQHEVSLSPTLQQISEQPQRGYYQYWGINE